MTSLAATIDWQKVDNLIPAIVQDTHTRQVLMLGYMNREALEQTQASQRVTFFSRTKERLWQKGETSGNFLTLTSIQLDCDQDTLLVEAGPAGPTCHLGTTSCFGAEHAPGIGFLGHLETIFRERHQELPEGSYTTRLFKEGIDRISQKVGEEAVETVSAAKNTERDPLINEVSDLVYHLLVLLREKSVDLNDVVEQLRARHSS